ncbi:hypothetical protein, partial [Klebsiella pneumoniae]|uniref:hypothetical protein n=1 Tax=Klebsiella pneumoniae TaxID=573 RepID=UPI001C701F17
TMKYGNLLVFKDFFWICRLQEMSKEVLMVPNTGIVFGLFLSLSVFFPKSQRHPVSQTPAGLWMSRYSTPFLAYTIHLHINRILWKGRWQRWNRKRGRRKEKTCT